MNLMHFFADALFPKQCYGCKQADTYLCEQCTQKILEKHNEPQCPHCNKRTPYGVLQGSCYSALLVNRLFVATTYKNLRVKDMFIDFKYHRSKSLAQPLAQILTKWLLFHNYEHTLQQKNAVIVPVPSHPKRERERGFHPANILAQHIAQHYALPIHTHSLKKHQSTPYQSRQKTAQQRKQNIQESFSVADKNTIKGKHIILFDDIITTGATMRECAKTLRTARPKTIIGLAIARQGLE